MEYTHSPVLYPMTIFASEMDTFQLADQHNPNHLGRNFSALLPKENEVATFK
jgi:hypothetical protein